MSDFLFFNSFTLGSYLYLTTAKCSLWWKSDEQ